MSFQVRGVNGETYTVQDTGGDGRIDAAYDIRADDAAKVKSLDLIKDVLDGVLLNELPSFSGEIDLDDVLDAAGATYKLTGKNPAQVKAQVAKWKREFATLQKNKGTAASNLEAKQKALQALKAKTPAASAADIKAAEADVKTAKAAVTAIDQLLKVVTEQLQAVVSSEDAEPAVKDDVQKFLKDNKVATPDDKGLGKGKAGTASVTINSGLPMYATGAGGASGAPGGGLFGMTPQPTGYPPFDPAAFYQSGLLQQYNAEGMDAIMAQQSKAQKMMMLFFYFAQQAMTGDIGAMYQFVRFITALITKDKAHQNVAMAEKLIQLQDASRKATDIMLKEDAYDPENPEVAANFSKVMERSKADQGEIAVSQKLIAQMLEEFSQVSEAMTGLQKSLLDARGRIMGMESVWRG